MLGSLFTMDHVVQVVVLILVFIAKKGIGHVLDEIKEMRADIAKEHERFKDYVQNERCAAHRQEIDRHIVESEARISRMLKNCKRHEEELG